MDKLVIISICFLMSCCLVLECEGKGGRGGGRSHSSHGSHSRSRGSSSKSSRTSSSHTYPASTGLSGSGHTSSHSYPASTGLSGNTKASRGSSSGSGRPRLTSGSRGGYNAYLGSSSGAVPIHPQQPQYVYVQHYQDTNSKYSDLLTGLTLYNMARSHHHHYNHYYYHDSYYHDRYITRSQYQNTESDNNSGSPSYEAPKEQASCSLRIKEKYSNTQVLKIPCEIVSTFTEGSKTYGRDFGKNECSYDYDGVVPSTIKPIQTTTTTTTTTTSTTTTERAETTKNYIDLMLEGGYFDESLAKTLRQIHELNSETGHVDIINPINIQDEGNREFVPSVTTTDEGLTTTDMLDKYTKSLFSGKISSSDSTDLDLPDTLKMFGSRTKREYNDVNCINNATKVINDGPLQLDTNCVVEIRTSENVLRHDVKCEEIMELAKTEFVPEHDKKLLPSADKIKSWIDQRPWWMSLFVAV